MTPQAAVEALVTAAVAAVASTTQSKYEVTVWFDLDGTLFVMADNDVLAESCAASPNLTIAETSLYSKTCYLIFLQRARELFQWLISDELKDKVRIGIATSAEYDAEEILPFLEREYKLPGGSLRDCKFINAYVHGTKHTPKGDKLLALCYKRFFNLRETILLVDDTEKHLTSAEENGFIPIHAKNNTKAMQFDPEYFSEVRAIITERLRAAQTSSARPTMSPT